MKKIVPIKPARPPICPAKFLKQEMLARGWSEQQLSEKLGTQPEVTQYLLDAVLEVSELATELSEAFGSTPELWINLQRNFDEWWKSHPDPWHAVELD